MTPYIARSRARRRLSRYLREPQPLFFSLIMSLRICVYDHERDSSRLPSFADIQIDCMQTDHTIATFARPWDKDAITQWWTQRGEETASSPSGATDSGVRNGARWIVYVLSTTNNGKGDGELAGYGSLSIHFSQTGPFYGAIEKLMVSPNYRRRGIARSIIEKLEAIALEQKRTLLMLDTETGSPAEKMYLKLGYVELGKIPQYAISPRNQRLVTGTFFYKTLPEHELFWAKN